MNREQNLIPSLVEPLADCLRQAWSRETSVDPGGWSRDNPAWGQCAITALIVQDHFGGRLLRSLVAGSSHYFNELPSGEWTDLTREQFDADSMATPAQDRTREYVLSFPETRRRYEQLKTQLLDVPCERGSHG